MNLALISGVTLGSAKDLDGDDKVGILYENRILTPEKMAEEIIQRMVEGVAR
jgi:hypothetical protein